MDKILHFVYKIYKRIRPSKRLYKYGTIGLSAYDDRTKKEKFFDRIDEFFFQWQQRLRYKRAYRKAIFNSYFDFGLGKVISSTEEIRKKEKQGYAYTTFKDMENESDRIRARIKREDREKTKKHFREVVGRIKSGNSHYHHDLMQKVRENQ
ncbi:MAG: hypothetical protein K5622_07270 [Endomicrobiaceae bacterium]|nr:hypothetical protein [Endomicrobiaceae bacterium]